MKNLAVRTVSGGLLAAVVVGAVVWTQWSLGALLLVLLAGGLAEFYALAARDDVRPQRAVGLVMGAVLLALNFAFVCDDVQILGSARHLFGAGLAFLLLLIPGMLVCELYRRGPNPVASVGVTLLGVCYVALPLSLMCYIPIVGSETWNPWVLVACIVIVWANDVFAYLVGMAFGRHPLFERLSPKKTWEGFVGGLAGAIASGIVCSHLLQRSLWFWVGLAAVVAVAGVLGDLVESMFKRSAGVKDSGRTIPGHGGVLDRFDALLLATPFVFVYLLFAMD